MRWNSYRARHDYDFGGWHIIDLDVAIGVRKEVDDGISARVHRYIN